MEEEDVDPDLSSLPYDEDDGSSWIRDTSPIEALMVKCETTFSLNNMSRRIVEVDCAEKDISADSYTGHVWSFGSEFSNGGHLETNRGSVSVYSGDSDLENDTGTGANDSKDCYHEMVDSSSRSESIDRKACHLEAGESSIGSQSLESKDGHHEIVDSSNGSESRENRDGNLEGGESSNPQNKKCCLVNCDSLCSANLGSHLKANDGSFSDSDLEIDGGE